MFDPIETPSTLDFDLYFPHELRNVTAKIILLLKPGLTEISKTPLSVSCNYDSSEDVTRVSAKVEASYGNPITYYIRLDFVWIDPVFQVNHLEYRLLFPFSFFSVGSSFDQLELYVILPKGSIARSWFPQPTSLLGDPAVRSFYWNLSSVLPNPTVSISYEMSDQKELRETLVFWAGIFIGLGVPISVSSLVEILKYRMKKVPKRKAKVEKETTSGNVQTDAHAKG
jgi:hypothetical protein